MNPEEHIIPAVAIIAAFGFLRAIRNNTSPVRALVAALVFGLVLSLLGAIGMGQIAGALAMVAIIYVVITQGGDILALFQGAITATPAQGLSQAGANIASGLNLNAAQQKATIPGSNIQIF